MDRDKDMKTAFLKELERLINRESMENGSDTPDFILAGFLGDVLEAWDKAIHAREKYYGRTISPATTPVPFAGVCPLCGHALDAEAKCENHGPQIPAGVKYMRVCKACGHQFEGNANICPECNAA